MLHVPLAKVDKNWNTALFFVFLVTLVQGGSGLLVLPLIEYTQYAAYACGGLLTLLMIVFLIATFKNPGYIKSDNKIDFQALLISTDPYNICPDCKIIRTPRSRH